MASPSNLGDLAHQITVVPFTTSTAPLLNVMAATDTGTVVASGRALDLSKPIGYTTTGGKPLDATVNPEARAPVKQFRSIGIAVPLELVFDDSGDYLNFSVAHQHRSATSGAGSTWATIATTTKQYRAGTTTDGTYHVGFAHTINAQAVKRYFKSVATLQRRLSTDITAKDTTTGTACFCLGASYIFGGASDYPAQS